MAHLVLSTSIRPTSCWRYDSHGSLFHLYLLEKCESFCLTKPLLVYIPCGSNALFNSSNPMFCVYPIYLCNMYAEQVYCTLLHSVGFPASLETEPRVIVAGDVQLAFTGRSCCLHGIKAAPTSPPFLIIQSPCTCTHPRSQPHWKPNSFSGHPGCAWGKTREPCCARQQAK